MRILILGPSFNTIGGIQSYLEKLTFSLKKDGFDVYYFSQSHKREMGVLFYFSFFIQYVKFIITIRAIKPDIVHLNPSFLLPSMIRDFLFLKIARINSVSNIVFIRGWYWNFYDELKEKRFFRKLIVDSLKKADKILVLSKDFKQALVEIGVDECKIEITSTMVESNLYLSEFKTFDKPYKILFCAYMAKYKGPYELIDAISKVLEHETNVHFIFMGDGPELNNLRRKTKDQGIEEYVTFTGYKTGEEKYNIFKKSHVFILPSYTEGFPNVVLEAMAAGLPIISTAVGGLQDAIKNDKNGFLIESNPPDPKEISNTILKMTKDPNMMVEMSKFNMKEAKRKYDIKVATKEIENIYLEINNKKH